MDCRDFNRLIDEQLDAREAVSPELERALESHRSACLECGAMAARYQTLRLAIAALGPPPVPPADFAARFLRQWEQETLKAATRPRILRYRPALLSASAVAAALLLLALGLGGWSNQRIRPATPVAATPPGTHSIDANALSSALAEATAATWDFARATSAPAARVGLEVIEASELSATLASLSLPAEDDPASEVLQDMGERINEGVQPLSGTARHAFGFLLGPSL